MVLSSCCIATQRAVRQHPLAGKADQRFRLRISRRHENLLAFVGAILGGVLDWLDDVHDLADRGTTFHRNREARVPDSVREILKERYW
jgi:hypothetical protein